MKRVYVAGAYSADNVVQVLNNMGRGIRASLDVLLAGYAPFVPWFDYHFNLYEKGEKNLTVQHYYNYSMAWLEASDAVLVLPNSENSKGTQKELQRAKELNIPIFDTLGALCQNLPKE